MTLESGAGCGPGWPMPEKGHPEPPPSDMSREELLPYLRVIAKGVSAVPLKIYPPQDQYRRWVRLCVLWYVCGLATGLLWGGMLAKARGIW